MQKILDTVRGAEMLGSGSDLGKGLKGVRVSLVCVDFI